MNAGSSQVHGAKCHIRLYRRKIRGVKTNVVALASRITRVEGQVVGKDAMKKSKIALNFLIAAGAVSLVSTSAFAYSQKVKDACSADYGSLCAKYKQGSSELRRCFESNRRVLSTECVQALVDAGEVPARYLKERK